ncbi:MAG: hemolysin III family protein [Clostridia bacterium]|nr:hemolysin III family protein [Clostridia bacterium]
MDIESISLVGYTKKEELINSSSHILGALLSCGILFTCFIPSARRGDNIRIICSFLYFFGTFIMFVASALYHGIKPGKTKKTLRLFDHCMIFFAVAGTSTGCVPAVYDTVGKTAAILMAAAAWTGAVSGLIMTLVSFEKTKTARMICYILTAAVCAAVGGKAYTVLPHGAFFAFLGGSAFLITGIIIYGLGRKRRYFHSVFHFFILGGLIVYYLGIETYCF